MITISPIILELIGSIILIGGTVFGIFLYFQRPQIALEKRVIKIEETITNILKEIVDIQKNHLEVNGATQKELKENTTAINELSKTVVKLSTIIDERIPKGRPNLTPPGQ